MTAPQEDPRWDAVLARPEGRCAVWVRTLLKRPGLVELTPGAVAGETDCSEAEAEALLDAVAQAGLLRKEIRWRCACCAEWVSESDAGGETCPECGRPFADCEPGLTRVPVYLREAERGRSVPWVLVLHGMNTRGRWQEELSWLIATTYGRSVPVFIYKYGKVLTGVLLSWRRRALTASLAERFRQLAGEHGADRFGSRPDVIAHSFGTWMLAHALAGHRDLAVDRIILAGSIVRPDFAWTDVLERGQADAVLNHYGTRDRWAKVAAYFIVDAGPSGRRGFDPGSGAIDRREDGFTHSEFFSPQRLPGVFGTAWKPFLTAAASNLGDFAKGAETKRWQPPAWPLRVLPRLGAATLAAGVFALALASLIVGLLVIAGRFVG